MPTFRHLAVSLLVTAPLALAGCGAFKGQPLPEDKAEYAGHWAGGGVNLTITKDGTVQYTKLEGGKVEINAPIQSYVDEDFVVGVMGIETTFDVQDPPHEVDGAWMMTVDGVELTRLAN